MTVWESSAVLSVILFACQLLSLGNVNGLLLNAAQQTLELCLKNDS